MKLKKIISAVTASAMILSLLSLTGCSKEDNKQDSVGVEKLVSEYGFQWTDPNAPILNEKGAAELSFNIYSSKNASALDYNDMKIMDDLFALTNVNVNWENVSESIYTQQKSLIFGNSSNRPDALFHAGMSPGEIIRYAKRKTIVPISDYLEYMPNFKKILDERPDASSDSQYGPYSEAKRMEGKLFYAAKHVEDGNNSYMVGWARRAESPSSTQDVGGWAGNLLVQKLALNGNGELVLKPVDKIAEQFTARRALKTEDTHIFAESGSAFGYYAFTCYESFMITGEFRYTGSGSFGLSLDFNNRKDKYKLISISPADQKLSLSFNEGTTPITETAINIEPDKDHSFTYIQEGSVGVFYIDDMAALTVRIYGASGKTIRLFAENNSVLFSSLRQYTKP